MLFIISLEIDIAFERFKNIKKMIDVTLPFNESTIESFTPDVDNKVNSIRKTPQNHSDSLRKLLLLSQNQPSEFQLLDQSTDSSIQSDGDFEIGSRVFIKRKVYSYPALKKRGKLSVKINENFVHFKKLSIVKPKKQKSEVTFDQKLKDKFLKITKEEDVNDFKVYTEGCMELIKNNSFFKSQQMNNDYFTKNRVHISEQDKNDILNDRKKLLVLDLDETLTHCETNELNMIECDKIISIKLNENKEKKIGLNIRPGLEDFLTSLQDKFVVVLFTASLKQYADSIVSEIDPEHKYFKYLLCRHNCVSISFNKDNKNEIYYVKDLRVFDIPMEKIVIVDNSILSFVYQINNGIPILPFYSNDNDNELQNLLDYLHFMTQVKDVTKEIQKSFGLSKKISAL